LEAVIEKLNNAKAALLYAEIDRNPLFKELPQLKIVLLNATFLLNDESHAATFDVMWKYLEYQDTVQWVTELQCTMHYQ
jgi:phosphoserine aminotransferase